MISFLVNCATSTTSNVPSDPTAPPTLKVENITLAENRHSAYQGATISISEGIVTISGIKNKEDGFEQTLTFTIGEEYRITERGAMITGEGNTLILAGAKLNPDGVRTITTMNDEDLTFTVTSAQSDTTSAKYYVHLNLGALIQLKLLGGNAGDLVTELLLSEGMSNPNMDTISLRECGVFPPPHEVLIGGNLNTTATYTLAVTPAVDSYSMGDHNDISLTLNEGSTKIATFSSLTVMTSECRTSEAAAALLGDGTSSETAYIIDNDRRLNLVAQLINANAMNGANNTPYTGAHYKVTKDIDLGVDGAPWKQGGSTSGGFTPMGTRDSTTPANSIPFTGMFDCQSNEIANLYISRGSMSHVGLFGYVSGATIQNCGLTAVNVTGDGTVGGLVGWVDDNSMISNSYATGRVSGSYNIGGLVGQNGLTSTISTSYATGMVSGANNVGGLVGRANNSSMISSSYATGMVSGTSTDVGGLVGDLSGSISNSYATGMVSGTSWVGGLVGSNNSSTISNSYATGEVSGASFVGGLVGQNGLTSTISTSYATGTVEGNHHVGGLVGWNFSMISNSYATGMVSGSREVGGLVGTSLGSIGNSYATGDVSGDNTVGGLVGYNFISTTSTATITNSYATGNVTGTTGGTYIGLFIGANGDFPSGGTAAPTNTGVMVSHFNSGSTLMVGTTTQAAKGVGSDGTGGNMMTGNVTGLSDGQLKGTISGWSSDDWEFASTSHYPRLKNVVCPNRQYPSDPENPPMTCESLPSSN